MVRVPACSGTHQRLPPFGNAVGFSRRSSSAHGSSTSFEIEWRRPPLQTGRDTTRQRIVRVVAAGSRLMRDRSSRPSRNALSRRRAATA